MTGESFISRHGLVRYTGRLGARYPRTGACEIGICVRRAEEDADRLANDRARLAAVLAELAALEDRARDRRRNLDAERGALTRERDRLSRWISDRDSEENRQWEARQAARPLFFDHCHRHGWVRGLLCLACNNEMSLVDAQIEGYEPGPEQLTHWNRCPECAAGKWRPLWRIHDAAGAAAADAWEVAIRANPDLPDAAKEARARAARLVDPAVVHHRGLWCIPIPGAPAKPKGATNR